MKSKNDTKSDAEYLRYLANKINFVGNILGVDFDDYINELRYIAEKIDGFEKIMRQQAQEIAVLMKGNIKENETN